MRNNQMGDVYVISSMSRRRLVAILLLIVVAGSGCGPAATPSPRPSASPSATPTPTPTATPQVACADRVFATMTLDQRIGQLFELGLASDRLGAPQIPQIQNAPHRS